MPVPVRSCCGARAVLGPCPPSPSPRALLPSVSSSSLMFPFNLCSLLLFKPPSYFKALPRQRIFLHFPVQWPCFSVCWIELYFPLKLLASFHSCLSFFLLSPFLSVTFPFIFKSLKSVCVCVFAVEKHT